MKANEISIADAKEVIKTLLNVDIMQKSRKRENVEGRMIYALLMHEYGHQLTVIGRSLGKDHTTIIHYLRTIDGLIETQQQLRDKYLYCRDTFMVKYKQVIDEDTTLRICRIQLTKTVEKLNEITRERDELKVLGEKYRRLESIANFVDENTPKGSEDYIERCIKTLFNDLKK